MSQFISQKEPITLVCFAIKEEAAPLRAFVHHNPSVSMLITGMGKRNAVKAVERFLGQRSPSLVLTCGFAGGLDPALASGTVIYEEDETPDLARELERLGARRARFYCASRIAVTRGEKRALRETEGADVVEMESGHIRALCRLRRIPSVTVRVISDTADEDLPLDFNAFLTPDSQISYMRMGLALLRSPGSIPRLLAMRRRTLRAAESLTTVLTGILQTQ
jgi:adenosylhomocysteine nucleosidase